MGMACCPIIIIVANFIRIHQDIMNMIMVGPHQRKRKLNSIVHCSSVSCTFISLDERFSPFRLAYITLIAEFTLACNV